MNLSCSLHDLGRDSEGEPHGARAVETFERLLGPEAASVAVSLYDWAENLTAVNRLPEARHALERAISIWTKAGASEFFIAAGRVDLARIDLLEKHPREARERVEGAVEILAKQDPQLGAQARLVLAQALWPERRDRARAVGVAREARTALVKASAPAPKLAEVDAWLASHTTP